MKYPIPDMASAGFSQFKFPLSLSLQVKFDLDFKMPGLSAKQNYFSPSSDFSPSDNRIVYPSAY